MSGVTCLGKTTLRTILVQGRVTDYLAAVVDELLTELLRQCVPTRSFSEITKNKAEKNVRLALVGVNLVNHVLHVGDELGVGAIHDGNTAGSNLAVDGLEVAEENVVDVSSASQPTLFHDE